jgi:hypothetical protein
MTDDTIEYGFYDYASDTWYGNLSDSALAGASTTALTVEMDPEGTAADCGDVTVTSMTELTCTTSAHDAAVVDVQATAAYGEDSLTASYTYFLDGDLHVVKEAWKDAPEGATYATIMDGSAGATKIAKSSDVTDGTSVVWTYTVSFVPKPGQGDIPNGTFGSSDVVVNDDKLGDVCTLSSDLVVGETQGCLSTPTEL